MPQREHQARCGNTLRRTQGRTVVSLHYLQETAQEERVGRTNDLDPGETGKVLTSYANILKILSKCFEFQIQVLWIITL